MNECLTRLVGLDDCEPSTAIFTLNQIGLSSGQLAQMMDSSYATIDLFFAAMKEIAAHKITTDIVSAISPRMSVNSLLENESIGYFNPDKRATVGAQLSGIAVDFENQSEYLQFNLNSISLFLDVTGTVNVFVYDLTQGKLVATIPVTCVAGEVSKAQSTYIHTSNRQRVNLAFVYDANGVTSYSATLRPDGCSSCGSSRWWRPAGYVNLSGGVLASPFLRANFDSRNSTYGMNIEYSVTCNNAAWICTVSNLMGLAMLYKTAECIFEYSNDSSGQFSEQKVLNAQGNEDRYTRAQFNYSEELKKVLRLAKLPVGRCFSCNPQVEVLNWLP